MAHLLNSLGMCNSLIKTTFYRSIHGKQNYYDVLKLNKNCTQREIKRAYYELSKKYHPDRNRHCSPKLFLAVSEAYKILGKPESRYRYDMSLLPHSQRYRADYYDQFSRRNQSNEPVFYRPRRQQQPPYEYEYVPPPYPGMRNAWRMSNSVILSAVLLFMGVGLILQAVTFRHMMRIRREEVLLHRAALKKRNLEKSQQASRVHSPIQSKAEEKSIVANKEEIIELEQLRDNNVAIE